MAQDPEDEPLDRDSLDTSHDFDVVPLYESLAIDAEAEANVIVGLLEASGIPTTMVRTPYPSLGYHVQVPRGRLEEATRVIQEARAAGPAAAAEAEADSEKG